MLKLRGAKLVLINAVNKLLARTSVNAKLVIFFPKPVYNIIAISTSVRGLVVAGERGPGITVIYPFYASRGTAGARKIRKSPVELRIGRASLKKRSSSARGIRAARKSGSRGSSGARAAAGEIRGDCGALRPRLKFYAPAARTSPINPRGRAIRPVIFKRLRELY